MDPPKIYFIPIEKGCCKYLQQVLHKSKRKMGEREEWERFGHNEFTQRIDDEMREGRHCFIPGRQE
jgi:hypothetical protein